MILPTSGNPDYNLRMPPYRRSIFLINKKFQLRFSLYVCSWLLALSFVYPLIVYSLFDFFVRYASADPNGPPIQTLLDTRHQIMILLAFLQVTFLIVTFLISIFMSHRIAGPIYKLSKFFEQAKTGNLKDELFFREKDHFQEIAQQYNEMIATIRTRNENAVVEIERALPGVAPDVRPHLEKAIAHLRSLRP
ncbi:methyl-accepting chemotaxis protein [Bdellovibrionota bacterium FG-1]